MGCSIGAKILDPGREFVLYKNRDFARSSFSDRIVYDANLFAVQGTEDWGGSGASDRFSGFAAGINAAGLGCVDSNVSMRPGATNYDVLVQMVLERCASAVEALDLLEREVVANRYSWANLIVADRHGVAAVEVRDRVRIIQHPRQLNRANHHAGWGASPLDQDRTTTVQRYTRARRLLDAARDVNDIVSLCRSHDPESGDLSICRHGEMTTVYSYVLEASPRRVQLQVRQGNPCGGDYQTIELPFPPAQADVERVLAAYPGVDRGAFSGAESPSTVTHPSDATGRQRSASAPAAGPPTRAPRSRPANSSSNRRIDDAID